MGVRTPAHSVKHAVAHPMITTSIGTSTPTISHFGNTSYRFEPKMYGVADEKNGFGTSEMIFSVYSAMPKCQNFSRPYRGRDFLTAHCVCGGCALRALSEQGCVQVWPLTPPLPLHHRVVPPNQWNRALSAHPPLCPYLD